MIEDSIRMDSYAAALRGSVFPGCIVLDIGTGPGIMAMLACQFGAGRVYALEPDDAIHVARAVATANGLGDRIEFIQNMSTAIELPERANVIVSDLRSVLPLFQQHIPSIIDARQRHLAPGGQLIPRRDVLWVAPVEAPARYARHMGPWRANAFALDMEAARRFVSNTWRKARAEPGELLCKPAEWAVLDYRTIERADVHGAVEVAFERSGTMHGFHVWFDAVLTDGVHFSNSPRCPELIYGSAFFPIVEPVSVECGDVLLLELRADLVGDDYVWSWDTCVRADAPQGFIRASFRQTTFYGVPLTLEKLHRRGSEYVPALASNGEIDHFMLALMDGRRPLREIAQAAAERFPSCFARWEDALSRAGELSLRYSR
jgi:protein arginine N-methyltransferase 1